MFKSFIPLRWSLLISKAQIYGRCILISDFNWLLFQGKNRTLRADFSLCINRHLYHPSDVQFYLQILWDFYLAEAAKAGVSLSYKKSQKIQCTNRLRTQQYHNHFKDDFTETERLTWCQSIKVLRYGWNKSSGNLKVCKDY